ncbi:glycosyltransferase [Streptomyces sp. NBC_01538]|uniref:glycosyltransferase n=1 Tax=Streptomyces sp. NBC_01538 TaxID=2903897 RepID=UPI0038673AFE
MKKQSLCLCKVVKNESQVIERCLRSVRHLIDHWVICDTGSTDGTQDLIRRTLDGIPGELHEEPWIDFGSNRTSNIQLARGKADYLLTLDADHVMPEPIRWQTVLNREFAIGQAGATVPGPSGAGHGREQTTVTRVNEA